jgi:hypothetical protein
MVRGTYITEQWIKTFKRRRGFNCDDEEEEGIQTY